jgi:hypothetical protein
MSPAKAGLICPRTNGKAERLTSMSLFIRRLKRSSSQAE